MANPDWGFTLVVTLQRLLIAIDRYRDLADNIQKAGLTDSLMTEATAIRDYVDTLVIND